MGRVLAYNVVVALIGLGIGLGLKAIWPGITKLEMYAIGIPFLFVLVVLLPMGFKALRALKN